jgi:hypothetical protein
MTFMPFAEATALSQVRGIRDDVDLARREYGAGETLHQRVRPQQPRAALNAGSFGWT